MDNPATLKKRRPRFTLTIEADDIRDITKLIMPARWLADGLIIPGSGMTVQDLVDMEMLEPEEAERTPAPEKAEPKQVQQYKTLTMLEASVEPIEPDDFESEETRPEPERTVYYPSLAEVQELAKKVRADAGDAKAVANILKGYGVKKLSELTPQQRLQVKQDLAEMLQV